MIYLDHNATSPTRAEVVEAMLPFLREKWGNPSSIHGAGRAARQGIDVARRQIAALFHAHERQVVLTSGGTEANNLALHSLFGSPQEKGHLITSSIEHPSILEVCNELEKHGTAITRLDPDADGVIALEKLERALRPDTTLVSIMQANNETGVIQPVQEMATLCRKAGVWLHTDAVQGAGRLPIHFDQAPFGMISVSAHKFGGPKGVGALILNERVTLTPQLVGGGQERGRRAGTENLPAIVGFGEAVNVLTQERETESDRLRTLRDHLERGLTQALPKAVIFGAQAERLPNTTHIGIPGLDGETLVMRMDLAGFAISGGSACASGKTTSSHVLTAMGIEQSAARSACRITLGTG
ncbi:MAG: cysteine desulfurase, partial [Magnetococcales bacterium]|nr:cysteine desulfurase [Magnetococcales bacterium]